MTKEQTMSPLRTRMIEDMQLAGLSAKTQEVYLQAVTALVKHYGNRSPARLTEEEVRCYLLAVRQRNARGTFKTCHYGIQFFYRNTLGKDWALFKKRSGPPKRSALPQTLSHAEVGRILGGIRNPIHRGCFRLMYACGLRISEAAALPVTAIDKTSGLLRVVGKGNKERIVPVPQPVHERLRRMWSAQDHRDPAVAVSQWPADRPRRHPCPGPHLRRRRQGRRSPRRTPGDAAHPAPCLSDPALREKGGHPRRAGAPRPREHRHDDD